MVPATKETLTSLAVPEERTRFARTALDAAVAAGPGVAQTWAARATVAFESGDLVAAVADLTTAIELSADPATLFNRGAIQQARQQWAVAEEDFSQALRYTPDDADTWLRRAECRQRLGDTIGAAADLHQFALLAPHRTAEARALNQDEQHEAHGHAHGDPAAHGHAGR